ncbi:MAG: hypothetical protein NZ516_02710 [Raineya sp.]|nr:hypothetical protein [Raineya sp.]
MRYLKVIFILILIQITIFSAYSQEWRIGLAFSAERVKSDFENCQNCIQRGFVVNDSTRIVATPIVKGSRGVSLGILAEKKLSKHWIFSTGLYFIPKRQLTFENDLVFVSRIPQTGNVNYILKPEIEIPLQWGYSFNLFKKKLEITPLIGFQVGLGRKYYTYVETSTYQGGSVLNYDGFLQRYSPSFNLNLSYQYKSGHCISLRYFTQTLLPFGNAEWEEPYFTSGLRLAYQINYEELTKLIKKR